MDLDPDSGGPKTCGSGGSGFGSGSATMVDTKIKVEFFKSIISSNQCCGSGSDLDPDPLVRGMDPDPDHSNITQK